MAKTPVVPSLILRIRVRSRMGMPIQGATVSVDSPALTGTTGGNGFVQLTLTKDQVNALGSATQVTLRAKKHHHGPDPGAGKTIVPGELKLTPDLTKAGFDPSTPGLVQDGKREFLDLVLMDAGFNLGAATPDVPTRRLTEAQVQKELLFLQWNGDAALTSASEFQFNHDPASPEFAPCTGQCTLKSPAAKQRVGVQKATIANVKFRLLQSFAPSAENKKDQLPGQRFLRDKFGSENMLLSLVDQRHVVGLARLCKELRQKHGITTIYTQGVSGDMGRNDTHGHGLALDFGGCAKAEPASNDQTVRLGTDFIVFLHWGRVPMWDGTTVRANPSNPSSWTRLKVFDNGHNYTNDPNANTARLHYRLDPAPFQEPVPAALTNSDPALAAQLATVAPHFVAARALFQDIYAFATREYSDGNSTLGPLPTGAAADVQTPIDSHLGHFILHPDYPKPNPVGAKNGRQAHNNHLHFQLGDTHFPSARTT